MPRRYDKTEKLLIHESLLKAGCNRFGQNGFSSTTVEDIARDANVAKGTFYHFWDSKEAFFFACMEETEERFQDEIIEPLLKSDSHPADILGQLITETLKATETYPMIRRALDPGLIARIMRKLPPEIIERHQEKDRGEFALIAAGWDKKVFNPGIEPDILDGLFKGLLMMTMHKEVIGSDIFDSVMETCASVITAGMKALSNERIAGKPKTGRGLKR